MGFPVSTGIRVPARTFGKVQTSIAHAVDGVDALLSPSSYRLFPNLQVLNTVEVSVRQRHFSLWLFSGLSVS